MTTILIISNFLWNTNIKSSHPFHLHLPTVKMDTRKLTLKLCFVVKPSDYSSLVKHLKIGAKHRHNHEGREAADMEGRESRDVMETLKGICRTAR